MDSDAYPRSAVRRVSREASAPSPPERETNASRELGDRARWLQDDLSNERTRAARPLRDFADALAGHLPLNTEDRDALARVLGVPRSLAPRWLQDTVLLLRDAGPLLASRDGLLQLHDRLDAIGWAWADVPDTWSRSREEQVTRGWSTELDQRSTSP